MAARRAATLSRMRADGARLICSHAIGAVRAQSYGGIKKQPGKGPAVSCSKGNLQD